MAANSHRTNNRVVDAYAGVVTNDNVAYSIVDAGVRLNYAISA